MPSATVLLVNADNWLRPSGCFWPIPLKNEAGKRLYSSGFSRCELPDPALPDFLFLTLFVVVDSSVLAHAGTISRFPGGPVLKVLAMRLRFWAVAVIRNSSFAPESPRNRNRSTFRIRFMCANSISTRLRCRRVRRYAGVFRTARATSRAGS